MVEGEKKVSVEYDVIVIGAGIAGVAAATAAAKGGARVLLIGCEMIPGGDACTGLPILGTYSSMGSKCVGGVLDELLAVCKKLPGGYIGPVCDYRTVYGLCLSGDAMRLAICTLLKRYGVKTLMGVTATGVCADAGTVRAVLAIDARGETMSFPGRCFIDATGSGNLVRMAGGELLRGDERGQMQPVSLVFRIAGVDFERLLRWVRDDPQQALLAENPVLEPDRAKAAQMLYEAGFPYVAISADGPALASAIQTNEMYPCTAMFMTPTCMTTGALCVNSTRLAGIDADDAATSSDALLALSDQVQTAVAFLTRRVPGFERAVLSAIAPRLGVRETGRIVADSMLTEEDVVTAKTSPMGIGKGSHHVDIHGAGTRQTRLPIRNGGTYDVPFEALLPRGLLNVLAAGRCISSDRAANGSARVMGTCIVTGQASGAAASVVAGGKRNIRQISVDAVRQELARQGAIL